MELTLENLVDVTKSIYQQFDCEFTNLGCEKTLVFCLGQTGCGKSTLLNSLVHGPNSLTRRKLQNEKKGGSRFIIDVKEDIIIN